MSKRFRLSPHDFKGIFTGAAIAAAGVVLALLTGETVTGVDMDSPLAVVLSGLFAIAVNLLRKFVTDTTSKKKGR